MISAGPASPATPDASIPRSWADPDAIEAHLRLHPQVKEAIVLASQDEPGPAQLVAYVVTTSTGREQPQEDLRHAGAEIVSRWNTLYELAYSAAPAAPSFAGWTSSYARQPIPETEMQEWLQTTVARLRNLKPREVLEIGCGVGLLVQHLAPECTAYVGTDFSASALKRLRQWLSQRPDLKHVELLARAATELQDLRASSFDTVVLNSVIQYFPDMEYLLAVLKEAIRLLRPGGKIFLGDVRHLGLLSTFHSSVQLSKAADALTVAPLRRRIARAVAQETELVIDPLFFQMLPGHLPEICGVDVQLRRGHAQNELTRYRYDVVLQVGDGCRRVDVVCEPLEWTADVGFVGALEAGLNAKRWRAVRLRSIPNARLTRDVMTKTSIETAEKRSTVRELRRQLNELPGGPLDPQWLVERAEAAGYEVSIHWGSPSPELFDVQLVDRTRAEDLPRTVLPPTEKVKSWSAYANDPSQGRIGQQLIPHLLHYLKMRLPGHVMPSSWTVLKELPRAPDGMVDRSAL